MEDAQQECAKGIGYAICIMSKLVINSRLDHIVIGAATLEQGAEFIQNELGVRVPKGGEHDVMGTHNRIMKLGGRTYFELIAVNPKGKPPTHPRWFGLDNPYIRSALSEQPQLLTWVVNVNDISLLQRENYVEPGAVMAMTRNKLKWLIAIPKDGNPPGAGLLPTVIQWQTDTHPSETMADLECLLTKLEIHHSNPSWFTRILRGIGAEKLVEVHPLPNDTDSYLLARIQTPSGLRELSSYTGKD